MCLFQDVELEAAIPRSAIYRMPDEGVWLTEFGMSELEDGVRYSGGENWGDDWDWRLTAGSRAEGLTLEDDWAHDPADTDDMWLNGGPLGVYVTGGQQARGKSCLDFRPEGCSPAYCKLQISDLHGLKESTVLGDSWFDETCVEESDGVTWLNTYNTVRCMKDSTYTRGDSVSGPASQSDNQDTIYTLVYSAAHPDLQHEFRSRTRGPWPTADVINYLLQLPMMMVLVGHKLSPEFRLEARISWSHLEYKLIKELSESVRQGYIACKYVMKRFLKAHRGQNEAGDGRSKIGSYHLKTAFLHFLEKRPPSLITSPFQLFLDLLANLDFYLQLGKLPHYFLAHCDLLAMVGNDERHLARQVIREISSDPLNALLTSPTRPQQIYGEVSPDHLVVAFKRVSSHPTCEQSRKDLSKLLARVDERRRERFREQRESDDDDNDRVSGRAELTELVATLKQIQT